MTSLMMQSEDMRLSRIISLLHPEYRNTQILHGLMKEIIALWLLVYVLLRQGWTAKDIGLSFRWQDIPHSVVLLAVSYLGYCFVFYVLYYGTYFLTGTLFIPSHVDTIMDGNLTLSLILFFF